MQMSNRKFTNIIRVSQFQEHLIGKFACNSKRISTITNIFTLQWKVCCLIIIEQVHVCMLCYLFLDALHPNKIEQDCHPKQQVPDDKWTRKPLA